MNYRKMNVSHAPIYAKVFIFLVGLMIYGLYMEDIVDAWIGLLNIYTYTIFLIFL